MKTDLFQSCGHCWVFQTCWHIECSTFTSSSFRTWNNSTEIPFPLVALFVVMLPKAHLTSDSRMFGSRWVITRLWLSGSLRFSFIFLCSSSVYSCHLFLISYASVRSIPFLSFIVTIYAWNVPLVSLIFLKRSLVFPILLFSSISLHWSLRKAFLSLLCSVYQVPLNTLYQEEKERYILFLFSSDEYIFPFLLGIVYYVAIDNTEQSLLLGMGYWHNKNLKYVTLALHFLGLGLSSEHPCN